MLKIAVGSAIALMGAVLVASPIQASPGQSAAAAYSPATGAYGIATFANTLDIAKSAALQDCAGAGGTDCQIAATVTDGCVVLIVDADGDWHGGYGSSIDAAAARAYSVGTGLDPAGAQQKGDCTY
jgi:Domain of unknown function (DUF4189)